MNISKTRNGFVIILVLVISFCTVAKAQSLVSLSQEASLSVRDTITTSQERALIKLLNSSLQSLADKDRRGRMTGGYILLGLGIGSGLGGAATLAFGRGDDARIVGYSLLGGGVLLSGLSLIPFKVKSETERIYNEFNQNPEETPEQIHHKYFYWDRRFEELADKRKRERIIGGATSIIAAGLTSIFLVGGTDEERFHTFIWPAVGGVTALLIKTDTEQRYGTYRKAKEDIVQTTSTDIYFGASIFPRGGLLGAVVVRF